jgi:4-alpha-glucanotransferase
MKTMLERGAGILMPVSSLPSPYGIGTFGSAAYDFVDFLKKARQKYWQVLPLGPTSSGDSPYASFSAFAVLYCCFEYPVVVSTRTLVTVSVVLR